MSGDVAPVTRPVEVQAPSAPLYRPPTYRPRESTGSLVLGAVVVLGPPLTVLVVALALRLGLLDEFVAATRPAFLLALTVGVALFLRAQFGGSGSGSGGGAAVAGGRGAAPAAACTGARGRPLIHVHGEPGRHYANLTAEQKRTGSHLPPAWRAKVKAHEERHHRAARALGADGWWEYTADGGATFHQTNDAHLTPVQQAATARAGNGGSWWGYSYHDGGDNYCANWWINKLPYAERAQGHRDAWALARTIS